MFHVIAVIRLRGTIRVSAPAEDTLRMLGLKHANALALFEKSSSVMGMIKKVEDYVAWGELSAELQKQLGDKKIVRLKPPRKGLRSVRQRYPRGDVGYRGDKINDLIMRMM